MIFKNVLKTVVHRTTSVVARGTTIFEIRSTSRKLRRNRIRSVTSRVFGRFTAADEANKLTPSQMVAQQLKLLLSVEQRRTHVPKKFRLESIEWLSYRAWNEHASKSVVAVK